MSYILDALRKSDQQRRLGGVPTLPAASVVAAAPERSQQLLYALLGVSLVIAVGTTAIWLRPSLPAPALVAPIVAKPIELPQRQSTTAPRPTTSVTMEPSLPPVEPFAGGMPSAESAAPVTPRKPTASDRVETRNKSSVAAPRHDAVSAKQGLADNEPAAVAARKKPVVTSSLPSSIRKTLPVMSVAAHVYSDLPQDRLVGINGAILREGDSVAPDLRLEEITPDGMIFVYRGYRFRRSAQ